MIKFVLGLLLGLVIGVSGAAEARTVAAAEMKDGIVILTDETFAMCPEGSKLAVARTMSGNAMPGCWGIDEEGENVVIIWISPPVKFPTGAFKAAPEPDLES